MSNTTNPNINFALVEKLPENIERGTIYLSSTENSGFIKVGKDASTVDTIYDSSDSLFKQGSGQNSVMVKVGPSGASGNYSFAEGVGTTARGYASHAEGRNTSARGYASHAEGDSTTASGYASHAEGKNTTASGTASHAEGGDTTAIGDNSHAEGVGTIASGYASHAEGYTTTPSGECSHAEGGVATASGDFSHAEGYTTTASGDFSHAEGYTTTASGDFSHAEGYNTIASYFAEHAQGQYNVTHQGKTIHSIGIGSDNLRKNAIEITNDGKAYIYNIGSYDGISIDSSIKTVQEVLDFKDLTDKEYTYIFTGEYPLPEIANYRIFVDDFPEGIESYAEEAGYDASTDYITAAIDDYEHFGTNVFEYVDEITLDGSIYNLYTGISDAAMDWYGVLKNDSLQYMLDNSLEADLDNEYCPFIKVYNDGQEYLDDSSHFTLLGLREKE